MRSDSLEWRHLILQWFGLYNVLRLVRGCVKHAFREQLRTVASRSVCFGGVGGGRGGQWLFAALRGSPWSGSLLEN